MPKAKAKVTTNLGSATTEDAPTPDPSAINPAIDPSKTAEERMASLTAQHAEQRARQERGESPD